MRDIIKRSQVRLGEPGQGSGRVPCSAPEAPRAGARVVDLDSGAKAIEFTCSCGQTALIEIQCEERS